MELLITVHHLLVLVLQEVCSLVTENLCRFSKNHTDAAICPDIFPIIQMFFSSPQCLKEEVGFNFKENKQQLDNIQVTAHAVMYIIPSMFLNSCLCLELSVSTE